MRVIIKSCEKLTFWYLNCIGEVFDVKEYDGRSYQVLGQSHNGYIRKQDCEIVKPNDAAISHIKVDYNFIYS